MTAFISLLYLASVPFIIVNPESQNEQWTTDQNNTDYIDWMSTTGKRFKAFSISFLVIGILAFVLTILTVLFEDKLVASIVSKFPKQYKKKDDEEKDTQQNDKVIE